MSSLEKSDMYVFSLDLHLYYRWGLAGGVFSCRRSVPFVPWSPSSPWSSNLHNLLIEVHEQKDQTLMKLTKSDIHMGAAAHVTPRVNGGIRLAQGPAAIYLDVEEAANLVAWLARNVQPAPVPA